MGKMGLVYKLTSCRRFNSNSFRWKSAKNHTTRLLSQPNPNCACKVIETISKSKIRATAIAALHFNILTQITQLMMAKVIKCRQLWGSPALASDVLTGIPRFTLKFQIISTGWSLSLCHES